LAVVVFEVYVFTTEAAHRWRVSTAMAVEEIVAIFRVQIGGTDAFIVRAKEPAIETG